MSNRTILCLDTESLQHPELIGLEDENLLSQPWLSVFTDACKARQSLLNDAHNSKVWVVSSDSMDGINLAAALKADDARRQVDLVTFESSGSALSRCRAAGIGVICGRNEFVHAYAAMKEQGRKAQDHAESNVSKDSALDGPRVDLEQRMTSVTTKEEVAKKTSENERNKHDTRKGNSSAFSPISALAIDEPLLNLSKITKPTIQKNADFSIAVVSGSGGSGKSTLSVCAALLYQELGFKTLLLDADLQFGDMAYMLGRDNALTISDLIEEPERIVRIAPEDGMPAVIAAPEYLEQSELIMTLFAEIIAFVKRYFDVVVINTGAFWTEQHAQIIESVDKTLFVLDQRPSSVRACSRALSLCSRCGIAVKPFEYALNFCSRHALLTPLDISCAMQGISVQEIKDGGKEVGELLGASLPKELLRTKNVFVQSMRELCVALLPEGNKEAFQEFLNQEKSQRKGNPFSSLRRRRVACL